MTSGSELRSSNFSLRGVLDLESSAAPSMCFRFATRFSDTNTGRSDDGSFFITVLGRAPSSGGSCGSSTPSSGIPSSSPWVEFVLWSVSSVRLTSGGFEEARLDEISAKAAFSNPENEALAEEWAATLDANVALDVDTDIPSGKVAPALELSKPRLGSLGSVED